MRTYLSRWTLCALWMRTRTISTCLTLIISYISRLIRAIVSSRTMYTIRSINFILVWASPTRLSYTWLTTISNFATFTLTWICLSRELMVCTPFTILYFWWSRAVSVFLTYVACSKTNASIFTELTRCWLNCPFLFALESSRALLTHWLICNVIVLSSLALCHCWPTRTIVAYITRFFFAWYTTKARQAPITTALTNLTVLVIWTLIP